MHIYSVSLEVDLSRAGGQIGYEICVGAGVMSFIVLSKPTQSSTPVRTRFNTVDPLPSVVLTFRPTHPEGNRDLVRLSERKARVRDA